MQQEYHEKQDETSQYCIYPLVVKYFYINI